MFLVRRSFNLFPFYSLQQIFLLTHLSYSLVVLFVRFFISCLFWFHFTIKKLLLCLFSYARRKIELASVSLIVESRIARYFYVFLLCLFFFGRNTTTPRNSTGGWCLEYVVLCLFVINFILILYVFIYICRLCMPRAKRMIRKHFWKLWKINQ